MELNKFTIFNFNASRCSNLLRIRQFYEYFDPYDTMFVCIQEIKVSSAIKVFSDKYQVFINLEQGSQVEIGIVLLVKKRNTISRSSRAFEAQRKEECYSLDPSS